MRQAVPMTDAGPAVSKEGGDGHDAALELSHRQEPKDDADGKGSLPKPGPGPAGRAMRVSCRSGISRRKIPRPTLRRTRWDLLRCDIDRPPEGTTRRPYGSRSKIWMQFPRVG